MLLQLVHFLITLAEDSEAALLEKAAGGDKEAFGEIVKMYEKRVFRVARRMCDCDDDAWDVTQEAFIKAMRSIHSFNPDYRFFTWIYRIVINTSINLHRSKTRRAETAFNEEFSANGQTSTQDAAIEETSRDMLVSAVQKAVEHLTPPLRSVFVLRIDQELTYDEISSTLGIAKGTVMSRLNRARNFVRRFVSKELGYTP